MNPATLMKKPIVLVMVAVFLLIIFLPMASQGGIFEDLGWNTDGDTWVKNGWNFKVNFDQVNIIGSFKSDSNSEQFSVNGAIAYKSINFASPKSFRYALYIEGKETPEQRYPTDGSWAGVGGAIITDYAWHYLQPWTGIQIKTTGDVRLLVVMEVKIWDLGSEHTYSDWTELPWDGAKVLSGAGKIELPASEIAKSPFEAGEKPNLYVETGFSGGEGWTVFQYPPADRTDISQTGVVVKTLGDNIKGTYFSITVGDNWFKIGSTNKWRLELWNNYFARVSEEILAIDDKDLAPTIKTLTYVNNGNSFSYTVTTEANGKPVTRINVNAWYSYGGGTTMPGDDPESYVIYEQWFTVTDNVATFTVYPKSNVNGVIVVKVIAYDSDSRPSTPKYESFTVTNGGTDPGPDPQEQPFVWTTSALIIAVLIILGIIAIMFWAPTSIEIKIVLIMILGAAGAALVWMAGTLQILVG